ncbi:hypothetical protein EVAR_90480_1 [Eumeta japonica]|uniref:Uncharacterized protein n=1 Tax=Eumeta variegata TaxID=151549 RepID=A0A4C2ABU9_EUMVA|nr:hypothetical protein EVAR_90480_1 [Eumeta japonica]
MNRINRVDCWKLSGPENVVKAGRKGASLSNPRDVDAAIGESASKLRTGREPRRPLPRRSRRRPQASVHRLPHNKSAKVVGGGGADGQNAALGKETDAGVLQRYRPSGILLAGEPEGEVAARRCPVGGPRPVTCRGTPRCESQGSTPVVSTR